MILDYKFPQLNGNQQLYSNPFSKKCLQGISMFIYPSGRHVCSIDFTSGNTTATQKILANNFQELVEKSQQFINSLED